MGLNVDDAEIQSYQDEITRLTQELVQKQQRIVQLETAVKQAAEYAERLGYQCSTLQEESVDLRMSADAIQNVLRTV